MKIVHIGLDSAFTEGLTYQDQMLVKQQSRDGHIVYYLTNCEAYVDGKKEAVMPSICFLKEGGKLIRLASLYTGYIQSSINFIIKGIKLPLFFHEVNMYLHRIQPDVIFCHNLPSPLLIVLSHYKKQNKSVKIFSDFHQDKYNIPSSGLLGLYYCFKNVIYRSMLKRHLTIFEKIFYIWGGTRNYLIDVYHISDQMLEFYPLGGLLPTESEYNMHRIEKRFELHLLPEDILLIHSGKIDGLKRTDDILHAFENVKGSHIKLIIIGSIVDELKESIGKLIESDKRVQYLGWKSGDELKSYLCAGDLYIQFGSASATMQTALCCGCPVLLNTLSGAYSEFMEGNGMIAETIDELSYAIQYVYDNPGELKKMKEATWKIAKEKLDYRKLAARIY